MKHIFILCGMLLTFSACKKELVDASKNQIEDITNLQAFKDKLASGTSVVFYYASWCEVCEEFRPTVENVSVDSSLSNVHFIEIEYDTNRDIFKEYSVNSFPTLIFFVDGVEQERIKGKDHTLQEVIDIVKKYL